MLAINTLNPAAVLGTSLHCIRFDDKATTGCYMQAYRDSKRTGRMSGTAFVPDPSTVLRVKALPLLADDVFVQTWDATRTLHLRGWEYDALLALVGEMYRFGVRPTDPLLCEQAQVAYTGRVPADYQQAYDQFVHQADRFLLQVDAMRLPALAKAKGIRSTVSPRRARCLTVGAKGVHVFPDPYDARYVRVYMVGFDEVTGYAVRDLAHDYYEGRGLRVQAFHV